MSDLESTTTASVPFDARFLSLISPSYDPFDEHPVIRIPPENTGLPKQGNEELLLAAREGGPIVFNLQMRVYDRKHRSWRSLTKQGYTLEFDRQTNVWKLIKLLREVIRAFVRGRCIYADGRQANSKAERERREGIVSDRKPTRKPSRRKG